MRVLNGLTTAAVVGFIVAVAAFAIQGVLTSTVNGLAGGSRFAGESFALPGLIGLVAAAGAFVMQWNTSGRRRRRQRA